MALCHNLLGMHNPVSINASISQPRRHRIHPMLAIGRGTRWLQGRFPGRPLKGLTRFARLLDYWLPSYKGVVCLPESVAMFLDSQQSAERWLMFSGNYQPALTAALKAYVPPGGYCLDIGANLGFYTLKFARWVGRNGQVAAFEANPTLVERIRINMELNHFSNISVVSAAVHNQSGQVEFYISPNPGKSSVNPMGNAIQKLVVPAVTIDEYVANVGWPRLDIIKMDIEGNDCTALLGARQTLTHFRPVLAFEYKSTTPPDTSREAFALLTGLNYTLWSLS